LPSPFQAAESANARRAGLSDVVQVIAGDALAPIPKQQGPFDLVFLDAWKPDYRRFLTLVYPRLSTGGLFLAHNVINKRDEMLNFLTTVRTHPDLFTSIVSPGFEGMSVSVRRRGGPATAGR
jgi:predicted O-methyltransferase YrrM